MMAAFDAAAMTGSFTDAARELNLTQGAVSRQVSALENQLDVILFKIFVERRLIEVVDTVLLRNTEELSGLLPEDLPETFTTADLAEKLGRPRRAAQQMAYCLRKVGAIVAVGKHGNAVVYRVRKASR